MDDRSPHSSSSTGQPSGNPGSRSGRRKRKRVRNSPRQLQERFTWEAETENDKSKRKRHRWGLIIFGGIFFLLFCGMVYIAYHYYKQELKHAPTLPPQKQHQLLPNEPQEVSEDLR